MYFCSVLLIFLFTLKYGLSQISEGAPCKLTNGTEGTLTAPSRCPSAQPQSYSNSCFLICCDEPATTVTPALKTLTRVAGLLVEDDPCTIAKSGEIGQCKLISNCLSALKSLQKEGRYPQTCSFKGSEPIVCCLEKYIPFGSCKFPNHPLHGTYKLEGTDGSNSSADGHVQQYRAISIECDTNYNSDPTKDKYSLCANGEWLPSLSTCSRSCPGLKSSKTTKITCNHNNVLLENCDNPIEGTVAEISCAPLHEEPGLRYNPTRICRDGTWDYGVPQCFPKCGQKRSKGHTNIINGVNVEVGDYPWHIGVYTSEKQHICGGAILNRKVILSAAHCFCDYQGNVKPKDNYLVAAGKYYRLYDDPKDENAQYSTIDSLHIPERYKGSITDFESDIAVIILTNTLDISESVQPVCIDLMNEFEYEQLTPNSHGIITGWGYTREGEAPSEELKELSVPYISYNQCFEEVPRNFRKYITYDKICAGYLDNSTAVCGGDSGGSLVFARRSNDRYYVRGIVSTSPATTVRRCDSNQYGAYTLVSKHLEFIKHLLIVNRI